MTEKQKQLNELFELAVTLNDWQEILQKQVEMAKLGNPKAVDFLFNRYFGVPKQEVSLDTDEKGQIKIPFVKLEIVHGPKKHDN